MIFHRHCWHLINKKKDEIIKNHKKFGNIVDKYCSTYIEECCECGKIRRTKLCLSAETI